MDIEYFELREDYAIFMADDTTRLRPAVVLYIIYIYTYISLRLKHRPKTLVTDHLIKSFLHFKKHLYNLFSSITMHY